VLGLGEYRGGATLPEGVSLRGSGGAKTRVRGKGGVGLRVAPAGHGGQADAAAKADALDSAGTISALTVVGATGAGVAVASSRSAASTR
jgi:hypothetical protein